MSVKEIMEQYTPEEIVEAFILPVKLTAKQKKEAVKQLAEHRLMHRVETTETERLQFKLLRLKFIMEDYIKSGDYNPYFTFGYFLEQYLQLTNRKKKQFADDIQIHETLLSQVLKNRREPSDRLLIRLELHSNNLIPAIIWFKLLEKEKEYQINTDQQLREKESAFVINSLEFAN